MSGSAKNCTARLPTAALLWRTSGSRWGHTFLLTPTDPSIPAWYDVYTAMFAGTASANGTASYVRARLVDESGREHRVHATTFEDAVRRDALGRPVTHYIAFVARDGVDLPLGWGSQVVAKLAVGYDYVFGMTPSTSGGTDEIELIEAFRARTVATEVAVEGPSASSVTREGQDFNAKKKPRLSTTDRPAPASQSWTVAGLFMAIALLGLLLLRWCRPR